MTVAAGGATTLIEGADDVPADVQAARPAADRIASATARIASGWVWFMKSSSVRLGNHRRR